MSAFTPRKRKTPPVSPGPLPAWRIFSSTTPSPPRRPFAALLGGAKVKDKAGVLRHILDRLDKLLIGGGMAAPFLKAQGKPFKAGPEELALAQEIARKAKEKGIPLLLPVDGLAAAELKRGAPFSPG